MHILHGDMLALLPTLPADSFDACVTDPPYGIFFMNKHWDQDIAFNPETWRQVLRVLKPGAHVAAFGGCRTHHRMMCAIEDAGFELREICMYLFGTGFPKSLAIDKSIDKLFGAEREVIGTNPNNRPNTVRTDKIILPVGADVTAPATPEAQQWAGWGSALKPAYEPIIIARKKLSEPTLAKNILKHSVGGLNVDACRVEGAFVSGWSKSGSKASENVAMSGANYAREPKPDAAGRYPANILLSDCDEVEQVFAAFPSHSAGHKRDPYILERRDSDSIFPFGANGVPKSGRRGDSGSASRFFPHLPIDEPGTCRAYYGSKANKRDRAQSRHPCIKPQSLLRWLLTLVTPPGGKVLDPFAGSGSTGQTCETLGFDCTLIEKEDEYYADCLRRFAPPSLL